MSASDKEIVETVIRNTHPLRGRVGTNLAGVLVYVIGITFACPVSSDTVARSDWEPLVARDTVERSPDLIVAYTSSSNHSSGPVTVALGYEPGCSNLADAGPLNSHLESDAGIASQEFPGFLRELCQTARLDRLVRAACPAEAAEERVRGDMGAII
eukprot:6435914-Pyramimonas_sp.AAC.1